MTIFECYNSTKKLLEKAGIKDYVFEAKQIVKYITGYSSSEILENYGDSLEKIQEDAWKSIVEERCGHYPLQYIIGEWSFYGLDFFVGEGCLVPRADTETLVDAAFDEIKTGKTKTVLDLCAGSGCIGITVAVRYPETEVTLLEKYDVPFSYCEKNIERHKCENVTAVKGDIYDYVPDIKFDLIVSNPPYVAADEMELVDEETRHEPDSALYGGESGLDFYVCILNRYIPFVNKGGHIAVEVGFRQAETVAALFGSAGLDDVKIKEDLSGVQRVVIGTVN